MRLTKNFTRQEFDCKDGTIVPDHLMSNLKELAENLQVLRDYLGTPIQVTGSGYRTLAHNRKVKGAPKSLHLQAKAADINARGLTPKQLYDTIEKLIASGKMKQGGLRQYDSFVHYDIRGTKARW